MDERIPSSCFEQRNTSSYVHFWRWRIHLFRNSCLPIRIVKYILNSDQRCIYYPCFNCRILILLDSNYPRIDYRILHLAFSWAIFIPLWALFLAYSKLNLRDFSPSLPSRCINTAGAGNRSSTFSSLVSISLALILVSAMLTHSNLPQAQLFQFEYYVQNEGLKYQYSFQNFHWTRAGSLLQLL